MLAWHSNLLIERKLGPDREGEGNFEIGRILCISNSKIEISKWTVESAEFRKCIMRFRFSNLRYGLVQFKIPRAGVISFPSLPTKPLLVGLIPQRSAAGLHVRSDVVRRRDRRSGLSAHRVELTH